MKRNISLTILLFIISGAVVSLSFIMDNAALNELALNSSVPQADLKMRDVSGKNLSLNDIKTARGLLVIFSCNVCPYVKLSEGRIKEFSDYCVSNGIGCVLVNSNEAQRGEEDSYEEMSKYYNVQKLRCAYVVDERSQMANAFGASGTPQCFLFEARGLVYKGAIDDNVKDASAIKAAYLKDALVSVLKNEIPKTQESKSIGCTIKRVD